MKFMKTLELIAERFRRVLVHGLAHVPHLSIMTCHGPYLELEIGSQTIFSSRKMYGQTTCFPTSSHWL